MYLDNLTEYHLRQKLACLYDVLPAHILELYLQGPSGIHILVSDHVSLSDFFMQWTAIEQNIAIVYFVFFCFQAALVRRLRMNFVSLEFYW